MIKTLFEIKIKTVKAILPNQND